MKIHTSLLSIGALALALSACTSKEGPAPTASSSSTATDEVVIPSQDEANAAAADAIDESNADEAFAELEKEINADQ